MNMRCIVCGSEMINTIGGNYNCPRCNHSFNDLVYRPAYETGRWGAFVGKNIYAFYSPFTNHDNKDDVAVVAALSKEEAISKLQKYYANASEDNVKEVEFNRDDICIICDTY